jgi:hypothetical protein
MKPPHVRNGLLYLKLLLLPCFLLSGIAINLKGQPLSSLKKDNQLELAFKAGTNNCTNPDLSDFLVDESYYPGYPFEATSHYTFLPEVVLNHSFGETILKEVR